MFNKEKTTSSSERQISSSATLISAGTVLKGDIISETDLRIDGTIKGNIRCSSKIIIGAQADITGKVQGNITVKEILQLRGESNVIGNLSATKLQIDPTATFNGQCQMGSVAVANATKASIVQMSTTDVQPAAGAK